MKLSPFELLTARFWPQNVNLRALWAKSLSDGPIIEEFGVDPYYVMMGISLVARSAPSARRADVLDLRASDIEAWWDRVAWGMRVGLERLREDCGLIAPQWLPYNTILVPLAAILAKNGIPAGPAAAGVWQKITRWYWCSVLGQTYESSPTSQMAKDTGEMLSWLSGGTPPESVRDFRFDPRLLRDITPANVRSIAASSAWSCGSIREISTPALSSPVTPCSSRASTTTTSFPRPTWRASIRISVLASAIASSTGPSSIAGQISASASVPEQLSR